jgi:hypothetical protein
VRLVFDLSIFLNFALPKPGLLPVSNIQTANAACSFGWWLMLICCERKVLLAGCWWLICSERKVLLAGG